MYFSARRWLLVERFSVGVTLNEAALSVLASSFQSWSPTGRVRRTFLRERASRASIPGSNLRGAALRLNYAFRLRAPLARALRGELSGGLQPPGGGRRFGKWQGAEQPARPRDCTRAKRNRSPRLTAAKRDFERPPETARRPPGTDGARQ